MASNSHVTHDHMTLGCGNHVFHNHIPGNLPTHDTNSELSPTARTSSTFFMFPGILDLALEFLEPLCLDKVDFLVLGGGALPRGWDAQLVGGVIIIVTVQGKFQVLEFRVLLWGWGYVAPPFRSL